jgi:DNA primase
MTGDHIRDYYKRFCHEIVKSDNSGSNGPCPVCGGTDRFVLFHRAGGTRKSAKAPELGSFKCRSCGISGDVIKFMTDFCGFTYPQALEELGLDNPQSTFKPSRRRRSKTPRKQQPTLTKKWKPQPEQHAGFVEDVEKWREHAEKFVSCCHDTLLQRQSALDWLAARGVGIEQVKRFRIGFNAGSVKHVNPKLQPIYKAAKSWGMPNIRRPMDNSHQKTIALNAGLIVPCYQHYDDAGPSGHLLRINIRSFAKGWLISKGSLTFLQAQQIINPGHDVAIVVESELDAFALSAVLSGVTIIPMGSAGGVPGKAANRELRHKQLILLCLDRDKIGDDKDLTQWRKDHPGLPDPVYAFGAGVDRAPEKWFANYPQCQPWYCPAGDIWLPPHERTPDCAHGKTIKDPGEAFHAGCDLAQWFREGLAYYSVAVPPQEKKVTEVPVVEPQPEPDHQKGRARPLPPQTPEWDWLIGYLDRRKIDIKVIDGEVSLVFTRALGQSAEGELERVSAAMLLPEIDSYLGQANDGVWRAEVFNPR